MLGSFSSVDQEQKHRIESPMEFQTFYPMYPKIPWINCFAESANINSNSNQSAQSTIETQRFFQSKNSSNSGKKSSISFSVESIIGIK